jgi:hypothetical protein
MDPNDLLGVIQFHDQTKKLDDEGVSLREKDFIYPEVIEYKKWNDSYPTFYPPEEFSEKFSNQKSITSKSVVDKFFDLFGIFNNPQKIDMSNVLIAGGSVSTIIQYLSSDQEITRPKIDDVDLFIYGMSKSEATKKLYHIVDAFGKTYENGIIQKTDNAVTLIHLVVKKEIIEYERRGRVYQEVKKSIADKVKIQIILRLYSTASEVLHGFDLGSSMVGILGNKLVTNNFGRFCIENRINVVVPRYSSPSYESRLAKYLHRGYAIVMPNLDTSKFLPEEGEEEKEEEGEEEKEEEGEEEKEEEGEDDYGIKKFRVEAQRIGNKILVESIFLTKHAEDSDYIKNNQSDTRVAYSYGERLDEKIQNLNSFFEETTNEWFRRLEIKIRSGKQIDLDDLDYGYVLIYKSKDFAKLSDDVTRQIASFESSIDNNPLDIDRNDVLSRYKSKYLLNILKPVKTTSEDDIVFNKLDNAIERYTKFLAIRELSYRYTYSRYKAIDMRDDYYGESGKLGYPENLELEDESESPLLNVYKGKILISVMYLEGRSGKTLRGALRVNPDRNKYYKELLDEEFWEEFEDKAPIKWMTKNPGTQLTGSFNPMNVTEQQWYGEYYKSIEVPSVILVDMSILGKVRKVSISSDNR